MVTGRFLPPHAMFEEKNIYDQNIGDNPETGWIQDAGGV